MPEEKPYSQQIYETLSSRDKEFANDVPLKDFQDGMTDKTYSKQIYDLLGTQDKEFTKDVNFDDFYSAFTDDSKKKNSTSQSPIPKDNTTINSDAGGLLSGGTKTADFAKSPLEVKTVPPTKENPLGITDAELKVADLNNIGKIAKAKQSENAIPDFIKPKEEPSDAEKAQYKTTREYVEQNNAAAEHYGIDKNAYKDAILQSTENLLSPIEKQTYEAEKSYKDAANSNSADAPQKLQVYLDKKKELDAPITSALTDLISQKKQLEQEKEQSKTNSEFVGGAIDFKKSEGDYDAHIKVLDNRIADLNLLKQPIIDVNKETKKFIQDNSTEVAATTKPTSTAKDMLSDYVAAQTTKVRAIRESLGLDTEFGLKQYKDHNEQALAADKRMYDEFVAYSKGDPKAVENMDALLDEEKKLNVATKLLFLNKSAETADSESGATRFLNGLERNIVPNTKTTLLTGKENAATLNEITKDADIQDAVYGKQQQHYTGLENRNEGIGTSAYWIDQASSLIPIMVKFTLAEMATGGAASLGLLGKIPKLTEAAESGLFSRYLTMNKYFGENPLMVKAGDILTKATYKGVKLGLTSEAVARIFPNESSQINFVNGFFAGNIGELSEKALAKTTSFSAQVVKNIFGNKSEDAAKVIEDFGEKLNVIGGKAKDKNIILKQNKVVVGNVATMTTQNIVATYQNSDNWQNFKEQIDNQYGSFSKMAEHVISLAVIGYGMGYGTEFGGMMLSESKSNYNKLPVEERVKVDEVLSKVKENYNKTVSDVENSLPKEDKAILDSEKDKLILAAQERLKLPAVPSLPTTQRIADIVDNINGGVKLGLEHITELSDYLYKQYKGIEALKSQSSRQFTIEQIDNQLNEIGNKIDVLEKAKNEIKESGEEKVVVDNFNKPVPTENTEPIPQRVKASDVKYWLDAADSEFETHEEKVAFLEDMLQGRGTDKNPAEKLVPQNIEAIKKAIEVLKQDEETINRQQTKKSAEIIPEKVQKVEKSENDTPSGIKDEVGKGAVEKGTVEGKIEPVSDKIKPVTELETLDMGDMVGKGQDAAEKARFKEQIINEPDKKNGTTGESVNEFLFGRVLPYFETVLKSAKDNTILVTHSSVLKAMKVLREMKYPDVKSMTDEQKQEFRVKYANEKTEPSDVETFKGANGEIHVSRHGQTEDNVAGNYRHPNTKLTEQGIKDAHDAAKKLKGQIKGEVPDIITSDFHRAIHTANILHKEISATPQEVNNTENGKESKKTDETRKGQVLSSDEQAHLTKIGESQETPINFREVQNIYNKYGEGKPIGEITKSDFEKAKAKRETSDNFLNKLESLKEKEEENKLGKNPEVTNIEKQLSDLKKRLQSTPIRFKKGGELSQKSLKAIITNVKQQLREAKGSKPRKTQKVKSALDTLDAQSENDFIAQKLAGIRISTKSFEKASDKNNITGALRLKYLSEKGVPIDVVAHDLINEGGVFEHADPKEVEKQIAQFMVDNHSPESYAKKMQDVPDAEKTRYDEEAAYAEQQVKDLDEKYKTEFFELEHEHQKNTEEFINSLTDEEFANIVKDFTEGQANENKILKEIENGNQDNFFNDYNFPPRNDTQTEHGINEDNRRQDEAKTKVLDQKIKDAKSVYQAAEKKYLDAKAKLDKNGQQDQVTIFGKTPAESLLIKNDLKSQKKVVDDLKSKVDEAKSELGKALSDRETFVPANQISIFDKTISALDSMKIDTKNTLNAFGIAPKIWNASIDLVKAALTEGKHISEAIQRGAKYLKSQIKDFDEKAYIAHMNEQMGVKSQAKELLGEEEKKLKTVGTQTRSLSSIAEALGLPEIPHGTRLEPSEYNERGHEFLKAGVDYQKIADEFLSEKNISARKLSPDEYSILRAHGEDLQNNLNDAYNKYGENSEQYKDAVKSLDNWNREVMTSANNVFAGLGASMQGVRDVNTGEFIELKRAFEDKKGSSATSSEIKKAEKLSNDVKDLREQVKKLEQDIIKAHESAVKEYNAPKNVRERNAKIANNIRAGKIKSDIMMATPVPFIKEVYNGALEVAAEAVEAEATLEEAVNKAVKFVEDSNWFKGLSPENKDKARKVTENGVKENTKESAETKNLRKLQKTLDKLRAKDVDSIVDKKEKREHTEREKFLEDAIHDEKERLGLIPSKPLPEQIELERLQKKIDSLESAAKEKNIKPEDSPEIQEKKEEFKLKQIEVKNKELQTKFANKDKKDNKFTPEEAKDIWDYAKREYLDKGRDYHDMLKNVSRNLGLTSEQVRNAISQPKAVRTLTDAMYRKIGDRRRVENAAKAWVDEANRTKLGKFIRKIPGFYFGKAVFGHGTVGAITHAAIGLFRPSEYHIYIPYVLNQFKYAFGDKSYYEKRMEDLTLRPNFISAKKWGLKNDPREIQDDYQDFGKRTSELMKAGDRGFNALKEFRQDLFDMHYDNATDDIKSEEGFGKFIAEEVNHSTGTYNIKVPKWVGGFIFAPKLFLAKTASIFTDPAKAIGITLKAASGRATKSEIAQAKIIAKRAGEGLAIYGSLLAANAAYNSYIYGDDEKHKVNMFNPLKPDFGHFKIGEKEHDLSGGLLSLTRFSASIVTLAVTAAFPKVAEILEQKKIKDTQGEFAKDIWKQIRYKFSPIANEAANFFFSEDAMGKPMMWKNGKGADGQDPYTLLEYALTQEMPIPISAACRSYYEMVQQMKESGMPDNQIKAIVNGLYIGIVEGFTGSKVHEIRPIKGQGFKSPVQNQFKIKIPRILPK